MYLAIATVSLLLAFVVFVTKGFGRWLGDVLLGTLLLFFVFTAGELAIGQITGNGFDDSVFFHLRTGIGGGDWTQYF